MSDFESSYYALRKAEGRVFSDEEVRGLPDLPKGHPLAAEWRLRKGPMRRLTLYLKMAKEIRCLDIGCGNGWLSHRIAAIPGAQVLAVDQVAEELAQARRVFGQASNLEFLTADIFSDTFQPSSFSHITLAASIQYFPDLPQLIQRLRELLQPGGEIHIIDSPFYTKSEIPAAKERTRAYYEKMGFPELAAHYHHHDVQQLQALGARQRYNPKSFGNRIKKRLGNADSPFGWWMLQK